MAFVRVHVYRTFANPHMHCAECGVPVPRWHDPVRCRCDGNAYNWPCRHLGTVSACPSWSPVDGCQCHPAHPSEKTA